MSKWKELICPRCNAMDLKCSACAGSGKIIVGYGSAFIAPAPTNFQEFIDKKFDEWRKDKTYNYVTTSEDVEQGDVVYAPEPKQVTIADLITSDERAAYIGTHEPERTVEGIDRGVWVAIMQGRAARK